MRAEEEEEEAVFLTSNPHLLSGTREQGPEASRDQAP